MFLEFGTGSLRCSKRIEETSLVEARLKSRPATLLACSSSSSNRLRSGGLHQRQNKGAQQGSRLYTGLPGQVPHDLFTFSGLGRSFSFQDTVFCLYEILEKPESPKAEACRRNKKSGQLRCSHIWRLKAAGSTAIPASSMAASTRTSGISTRRMASSALFTCSKIRVSHRQILTRSELWNTSSPSADFPSSFCPDSRLPRELWCVWGQVLFGF